MSKHTPGPWHVDRDGGERFIVSAATYEDPDDGEVHNVLVADLYRGGYDFSDLGYDIEANADLIARAPEMNEVLTVLYEAYGVPAEMVERVRAALGLDAGRASHGR